MRVYLVHHTDALTAEQDPRRPLSPVGREQADRIGSRLRALGVAPLKILHSDKLWTVQTAQHIAARLGLEQRAMRAPYAINTDDPVEPFIADVAATGGEIMMCGHVIFLQRAAARLVAGDEHRKVVEFKPGNGSTVCIERIATDWVVTWMWRADHAPG